MKPFLLSAVVLSSFSSLTAFASPVGEWEIACFPFRHISQSEKLSFGPDGKGSIERTIHANQTCSAPIYEVYEDLVFDTGLTYENGTTQINLNVLTAQVIPLSADGVSILSSQSYCGITEWILNEPQSVLGNTCSLAVLNQTYSDFYHILNEPAYTVFKQQDNTLFIGFPIGKTANTRQLNIGPFGYTKSQP